MNNDIIDKSFEQYMERNRSIYFGMSDWEKDSDKEIFKAAFDLLMPVIEKQRGALSGIHSNECDCRSEEIS